jgi:hypothetical protein
VTKPRIRSTLVEITTEGRVTADRMLPGIRTLERNAEDTLTKKESVQLLNLLAKTLARQG